VQRTALEMKRRVLLTTTSAYGLLAAAVPTSFVTHRHLVLTLSVAAALAGSVLTVTILVSRDLGQGRGRLVSTLLLIGPLGPVWLARRTRRWRPLLLVRPRPGRT
jgi:hypothetical protein